MVDLGYGGERHQEKHKEKHQQVTQVRPLVHTLEVVRVEQRLPTRPHRVVILPLINHQRTERITHQVDVIVPAPIRGNIVTPDEPAGEEQQSDHVRG